MSIESITFFEHDTTAKPVMRRLEAIVEFNEFDQPFAIEVLSLAFTLGQAVTESLLSALKHNQIHFSYDSEVDALTFSFGNGSRSLGQRLGTLDIGTSNENIALLKLSV
jgi:hypothetical protein